MYITDLHVQRFKLLRDFRLRFGTPETPRMWTVLIGENGTCKTSVLQAIACAAAGPTRANQLMDVRSMPDLRQPGGAVDIECWLQFERSETVHSRIMLGQGHSTLRGESRANLRVPLDDPILEPAQDYLEWLASTNDEKWFVAGYGTNRVLSSALRRQTMRSSRDPGRDRLASLFDQGEIIGTGFASLLKDPVRFGSLLKNALVETDVLPAAVDLELKGQNWAGSDQDVLEGDVFTLRQGADDIPVPANWLSQGYQSTIAWIADLIGQFMLQRQERPLEDLRALKGLVLIDEVDLHLHPKWQVELIPQLKKIFPRLQFVVTTHSPLVLAGCQADEIVLLKQDQDGDVYPEQPRDLPALLTASQIMSRFFEVDRSDAADLGADLRRYELLDAYDETDLEEHERAEKRDLARRLEAAGVEVLEEA